MKKLFTLLLALMMFSLPALAEGPAYPAAPGATITVTGSASVTLKADHARVSVGVSTSDATVEAATEKNNAAIHAVIEALKATGIPEADIVTSSYTVNPEYDYTTGTSVLSGYNVTNQLTVVIRDMAHIGATLDKATAAGANSIYNIEFLSTESAAAQDEATAYAVQDAIRKAKLLADAAGLTLGGITSISETTGGVYVTARSYQSKATADAAANSILPNNASVGATVTIVFELQ